MLDEIWMYKFIHTKIKLYVWLCKIKYRLKKSTMFYTSVKRQELMLIRMW